MGLYGAEFAKRYHDGYPTEGTAQERYLYALTERIYHRVRIMITHKEVGAEGNKLQRDNYLQLISPNLRRLPKGHLPVYVAGKAPKVLANITRNWGTGVGVEVAASLGVVVRLADTGAIALMLGVSPATVRSYARRGKLRAYGKAGRRTLYSLEEAADLAGEA